MGLAATWVCETAAQLESEIGLPAGSLQATVDLYNRHAAAGEDPLFHKGPAWVRPLVPPIGAVDLRIGPAPYAPFTLGGLETTVAGRGAATSAAPPSRGCSPPGARRRGCARSATPAGSPSATARCSAASPARARRGTAPGRDGRSGVSVLEDDEPRGRARCSSGSARPETCVDYRRTGRPAEVSAGRRREEPSTRSSSGTDRVEDRSRIGDVVCGRARRCIRATMLERRSGLPRGGAADSTSIDAGEAAG